MTEVSNVFFSEAEVVSRQVVSFRRRSSGGQVSGSCRLLDSDGGFRGHQHRAAPILEGEGELRSRVGSTEWTDT